MTDRFARRRVVIADQVQCAVNHVTQQLVVGRAAEPRGMARAVSALTTTSPSRRCGERSSTKLSTSVGSGSFRNCCVQLAMVGIVDDGHADLRVGDVRVADDPSHARRMRRRSTGNFF